MSHGTDEQGWPWVYDALPVRASLDWLRGRSLITVPGEGDARVSAWVETATHPDALHGCLYIWPAWRPPGGARYGRDARDRAQAEAGIIDRSRSYHLAIVNERIPTRLGEMSVDVPVEEGELLSPFGQGRITGLPVPLRWLLTAGVQPDATASVIDTNDAGERCSWWGGLLRLNYGCEGVQRAGA